MTCRLGIVGFGFVGTALYEHITGGAGPFEIAFVHNRSREALEAVPDHLIADDLSALGAFAPDLIVEASHPDVTVGHGAEFLALADYMPLSATALANDTLRASLAAAAEAHGRRLLIPHGALVGLDSLLEWREEWSDLRITFRKPPNGIDFSQVDIRSHEVSVETVVYDGPVRPIAMLFPRNVNAMVTCALATVGLDRCQARLIADPAAKHLSLLVEARGRDGSTLRIERQQPAKGVSGSEMFASLQRSLSRALHVRAPVEFV